MCEFGDHRCKGLDLAPQPSIVGSQFPVVITGLCKLSLHGLDNPAMREMQVFARRCRPFLQPFVVQKLGV